MKATGIVRKIDELGRIVIPKEIRKTMRIREGEPLEIFVDKNGEVVLKKYDPLSDLKKELEIMAETLNKTTRMVVCISDTKNIIVASGKYKNEYLNKDITNEVINILNRRNIWTTKENSVVKIIEDDDKTKFYSQAIAPIVADSDVLGAVYLLSLEQGKIISQVELKQLEMISECLAKLME